MVLLLTELAAETNSMKRRFLGKDIVTDCPPDSDLPV